LPALDKNIKMTIGTAYELIVVDNSKSIHSIFEAYNIGVSRSKFPILCFMHDDILYHSTDWGLNILAHFADSDTGAIGIAGTPYYPRMPGSWWAGGLVNETIVNQTPEGLKTSYKTAGSGLSRKNEVLVLDGVWLCIRKTLFERIKFDESQFDGFHFYDMDICMQIHVIGSRLYSITDIAIQHFYTGKVNIDWSRNAHIFYRKWKRSLPAAVVSLTEQQEVTIAYKTLGEYIRILLANNTPRLSVYITTLLFMIRFSKGYKYIPALLLRSK
jgi:GT2 family glycosyltransferase